MSVLPRITIFTLTLLLGCLLAASVGVGGAPEEASANHLLYRSFAPMVVKEAADAPPPPAAESHATLLAAGDVAGCDWASDEATAGLLDRHSGVVAVLGDLVYPTGSTESFSRCYDPTWGRHKARTRPVPGNHDYNGYLGADGRAASTPYYFDYFGGTGGDPTLGYYSYDLGDWHVVALDPMCDATYAVHCPPMESQLPWLEDDLERALGRCTLVYFHYPLFTSTSWATPTMKRYWDVLYRHHVDVVLNGHAHTYERFAPQDPSGHADPGRGIRQFIVGTGGAPLFAFEELAPNTEVRQNHTHGILKLDLYNDRYEWDFIPVPGNVFVDGGTERCH